MLSFSRCTGTSSTLPFVSLRVFLAFYFLLYTVACSEGTASVKSPPSCVLSESVLQYGTIQQGTQVRQLRVKITNDGDQPLLLSGARFSADVSLVATLPEAGIPPHSEGFLLFDLDATAVGSLNSTFRLDTNAPQTPHLLVKTEGEIRAPGNYAEGETPVSFLIPKAAKKTRRERLQDRKQKKRTKWMRKMAKKLPVEEQPL